MANAASLYVGMPLLADFLTEVERDPRRRLDDALTAAERGRFKATRDTHGQG